MVTCSEEKVCESDPGYFCGPKNHCGSVIYTAPKAIYYLFQAYPTLKFMYFWLS